MQQNVSPQILKKTREKFCKEEHMQLQNAAVEEELR
jgi:hypothetical protein